MKFGLTALAGLTVVIAMSGILVYTARTSEEIVDVTRASQQRMKGFTWLQERLDHFHRATIYTPPDDQIAKDVSPEELARRRREAEQMRAEFIAALENIKTLPITDPASQPARADAIIAKGYDTLAVFGDRRSKVERVQAVWEAKGQQAAVYEALRIYADFYALREMIQQEIVVEDKALENAMQRYESFRKAVIPGAVVCLILAILGFGMLLALVWRRLSPGLKKLELGAQAFGSGEMGHRIGLGGQDELSRLSRAFDSMAQQLALKQLSLQRFAKRQEEAVEARTRELEAANAALAATDERRRAFFADISHELRTQLTIIRGEAQIALRSADKDNMDAVPVLERILSQTRNLSRLVEDLFLIARAEAGGLMLHRETIELSEMIAELAQDFAALASEVGSKVAVESAGPVHTHADPHRVRQMLMALMDNALRHTCPNIVITLSTRLEGDWAVVSVSDNGPGFDPSTANELFGRFRRGKGTASEGAGLGLTLVRALAEAQGGTAELSNRLQGGATITIRLPGLPEDALSGGQNVIAAAG